MSDKTSITYLNLWKDICYYEVYMDKIIYEDYLIYLSKKYNIDTNTIIIKIAEAETEGNKRIKEHHKNQKDLKPLFKTQCEEEKIKTVIEYNRRRNEIKEKMYYESSQKNNENLSYLKTKK